jgi:uncharacterized protein YcnI
MFRNRRAAAVALGAAAFGALAFASPAAADVVTTPSEATRGDGVKMTLRLPEERPGAYTAKVELLAPESTPIGEIYPMSVDDWAPSSTTRRVSEAVAGLHGFPITEVTASITWIRVSGAPAAGQSAELTVSMGPMPTQGNEVVFTVVQTYSDGTVVRWADPAGGAHPAVVMRLIGQATGGGHHGGTTNQGQAAPPVASGADSDDGGSYGVLTAGLLAGLGLGVAGGWLILRSRRAPLPAVTIEREREKVTA